MTQLFFAEPVICRFSCSKRWTITLIDGQWCWPNYSLHVSCVLVAIKDLINFHCTGENKESIKSLYLVSSLIIIIIDRDDASRSPNYLCFFPFFCVCTSDVQINSRGWAKVVSTFFCPIYILTFFFSSQTIKTVCQFASLLDLLIILLLQQTLWIGAKDASISSVIHYTKQSSKKRKKNEWSFGSKLSDRICPSITRLLACTKNIIWQPPTKVILCKRASSSDCREKRKTDQCVKWSKLQWKIHTYLQ